MYNYVADIIGFVNNTSQNSTIISIAGFLLVMVFVVCLDVIINTLFSFFTIRERRK